MSLMLKGMLYEAENELKSKTEELKRTIEEINRLKVFTFKGEYGFYDCQLWLGSLKRAVDRASICAEEIKELLEKINHIKTSLKEE
ncbi:hypothetical protein [Thermodesulfovibrio sp.]|uniref:hypothetical protein n=1 Tax=Thermodesulfovibrio sp. TaxID=2067987 RepID=UPI0030AD123D